MPIPLFPTLSLPPLEKTPVALLSEVESGRLPQGGIYARFSVAAPPTAVYALLADDAHMSQWIPHLARSEVVSAGVPCNVVAFSVPSPIGDVSYSLNRCHDGSHIWWSMAEGERFERMNGCYQLSVFEGGTLITYWSEVVATLPVPVSVQEEIARIGLGDLVDNMRRELAPK
jgi:hypothetical protein